MTGSADPTTPRDALALEEIGQEAAIAADDRGLE
jgi:hypothetical protein